MKVLSYLFFYFYERLSVLFVLTGFFFRSMVAGWRDRKEGHAIFRENVMKQILFTGVEALPFVIFIGLLVGAGVIRIVFVDLSILQDTKTIGKLLVIMIFRELGPVLTAAIIIIRSGTAITVELGYMNMLKESDALNTMGISHIRYIILPRLFGVTTAAICLQMFFVIAASSGGFLLAKTFSSFAVSWGDYLQMFAGELTLTDIIVGLLKVTLFGGLIAYTAMWQGYSVKSSFTEIPQAVSRTGILSLFWCLVFNFVITLLFTWIA